MEKTENEKNESVCPMIAVHDLRKEYYVGDETVVALRRLNFTVSKGELCCIFGTSGSGKSTLLNQLAGLEKPTAGVGVPVNLPIRLSYLPPPHIAPLKSTLSTSNTAPV